MSVVVGYITANEALYLNASLNTMLAYPWVTKIVVLITTVDGETTVSEDERVVIYRQNFGTEGFEKTVEDGGFNEVEARNYLVSRMKEQNCDWLLLCDSDEYFIRDLPSVIQVAEKKNSTCVYLETWPYIPIKHAFFKPDRTLEGLRDPHIRLIKSTTKFEFKRNGNQKCINQTAHCVPEIDPYIPLWMKGFYHIHMFASLNIKAPRIINMIRGKELNIEDVIRLDESFQIPEPFKLLHLTQRDSNQFNPVDQMMMAPSYGSHTEILSLLTKDKNIVAFEEGMGYHSTAVFLKNCKELYSIEYSKTFYEMMLKYAKENLYFSRKCPWHHKFVEEFDDVENMMQKADLVFVDGGIIGIRYNVAQLALKANKKFVIVHDWEYPILYKYNQIDIPKHYFKTVFRHHHSKIETAVFSLEPLDIQAHDLKKHTICA